MASRKYLIVDKRGVVARRKLSAKNRKANYKIIGSSKGRLVLRKTTYEAQPVRSRRYKVREKMFKPRVSVPLDGETKTVEVTGLVSVSYESKKKSSFHAEMLFRWYGNRGFDENKLLDGATEILMDTLPNIEKIPFELASVVSPDFNRRGIESTTESMSGRINEMDFEIFIPKVGGRALTSGSARLNLE
jgi:hypothetical protein